MPHTASHRWCHLSLSAHHAIIDGWRFTQLLHELLSVYAQLRLGDQVATDPVLPGAYHRFVAAERAQARSGPARSFWSQLLAGSSPLPLPPPAGTVLGPRLDPDLCVVLDRDQVVRAGRYASELGAPLKSVMLAAHVGSVAACFGAGDVTIGVSLNGRLEEPGIDWAVGLFTNCLPLRVEGADGPAEDLASRVYRAEQELLPYRTFPLPELFRLRGGQPHTTSPSITSTFIRSSG